MSSRSYRPRRSALYVPASNAKALAKIAALACDCVIIDLEDAVAPEEKAAAREAMRAFCAARAPNGPELVVRINALSSEWGSEDLIVARAARPDAILLPKVNTPRDIQDADDALDTMEAGAQLRLWAMVETPRALLNIGAIAEMGMNPAARLACFVSGTNDLAKDTGVAVTSDRRFLSGWLAQIVLGARAGGLDALDGVSNDFRDLDAFDRECAQGRDMGFDGKTLIHPAQIEAANRAFSPDEAEIARAQAIVSAFERPENAGKGVISLDGKMVERLHLDQAERLLARAAAGRTPAG